MSQIIGTTEIHLTVVFRTPPNTTGVQAAIHLKNNGICVPLGLIEFVKSIDVNVVEPGQEKPKLV